MNAGTWDFDAGSDLTGTWIDDESGVTGTWSSDEGMTYLKYANSENMGLWQAIDGSYGNWTWTETDGGRWWNEDHTLTGSWDSEDTNEFAGTWSEDSTGITGTWSSESSYPTLKLGISDNFGVWYAPDGSYGNWTF